LGRLLWAQLPAFQRYQVAWPDWLCPLEIGFGVGFGTVVVVVGGMVDVVVVGGRVVVVVVGAWVVEVVEVVVDVDVVVDVVDVDVLVVDVEVVVSIALRRVRMTEVGTSATLVDEAWPPVAVTAAWASAGDPLMDPRAAMAETATRAARTPRHSTRPIRGRRRPTGSGSGSSVSGKEPVPSMARRRYEPPLRDRNIPPVTCAMQAPAAQPSNR
jgi:hypothetical protein